MFGAVALAPGFGAGWVELDPDADRPAADIALRPEQVIDGRLFDVQGQPVPNATVSVASIRREPPRVRFGVRSRIDGIVYGFMSVNDLPAWPRPAMTDAEGRFTVRGVGRGLHATMTVRHPKFALETIEVDTDGTSKSKAVTAGLAPSQVVNVRVIYADTGRPVPHAPLRVLASRGRVARVDVAETDAAGRARVNSWTADGIYNVTAYPPEGQPYLTAHGRINWPKGALEQPLDLALARGVCIRGKVTEEGSGRLVAGATVDFASRDRRQNQDRRSMAVSTTSDGSFQLGAEPGPGDLVVRVPGDDYVLRPFGFRPAGSVQPGGSREYAHAHTLLDLKPADESRDVALVVRRGATVKGQIVGPDGQPVREAWMFSRVILDPRGSVSRSWTGRFHGNVRDGRFELHGLDPDAEVPVSFLAPERKLGGVANLSSKSAANGPITVRLEPCGAARGRVVDPGGKPVAGPLRDLITTMVVTPGPTRYAFVNDKSGLVSADEADLTGIDPVHYTKNPEPDADGRIALPVLIPGVMYRVLDYTTFVRGQTGPVVRKELTVKPGETVDLGDIRIEKPPR